MSVVTSIRDYIDTLNLVSDSLGRSPTFGAFFQATGIYFLKTLQTVLLYIVSFQWIRDFTLLPIIIPKLSASIFEEIFILETPSHVVFDFLEIPPLHQNKFLVGFFNSFFFSLPFSFIHIIAIRRLLLLGVASGVYTMAGYFCGQILFLICVIFGLRSLLVPWLITFEPLPYIIGFALVCRIMYGMIGDKFKLIQGWNGSELRFFFLMSFGLAWCEQTALYQYLGNVTVSSNVSILESFSSSTPLWSFLNHFLYILGIAVGCVIFTSLWGVFLLRVKEYFVYREMTYKGAPRKRSWKWARFPVRSVITNVTSVLVISFGFATLPFYTTDYLLTGPLGFVPQDVALLRTPFSEIQQLDYKSLKNLAKKTLSSPESNNLLMDFETSNFDRGRYYPYPDGTQGASFEELNYRGERSWYVREDKRAYPYDKKKTQFNLKKTFQRRFQQKKREQVPLPKVDPYFNRPIRLKNRRLEEVDRDSKIITRFLELAACADAPGDNKDLLIPRRELSRVSFPRDFKVQQRKPNPTLRKNIKFKYWRNPLYRSLLRLDIDLLLTGQPRTSNLSGSQEIELNEQRRLLSSYYNSLRDYSQLPFSDQFEHFFENTKSFSNRVYNQQFKGTLRSIRRYFSLTLTNGDEPAKTILKFDQPLYQLSAKDLFSPYHEELAFVEPALGDRSPLYKQGLSPEGNDRNENDVFPSNWEEGNAFTDELDSEELAFDKRYRSELENQSHIFESLPQPFYAGWDDHLRKFVITNKFLPRADLGLVDSALLPKKKFLGQLAPKNYISSPSGTEEGNTQKSQEQSTKVNFTTWPLGFNTVNMENKEESSIPYVTLFEPISEIDQNYFHDDGKKDRVFTTLPANLYRFRSVKPKVKQAKAEALKKILERKPNFFSTLFEPGEERFPFPQQFTSLAPRRGGFVWPGKENFNFAAFKKAYNKLASQLAKVKTPTVSELREN